MPATASSRSASAKTTIGFLPPISATSVFSPPSAGSTRVTASCIHVPTAREPVKATIATSGLSTSVRPTVSPSPGRQISASGGTPASCSSAVSRSAISGVCSAGLSTTALPQASAAAVMPPGIASEKFHGGITATTPRAATRSPNSMNSRSASAA